MGVMACDRTDCNNIMCDKLICDMYICNNCAEEFKSRYSNTTTQARYQFAKEFEAFMDTPKRISNGGEHCSIDQFLKME